MKKYILLIFVILTLTGCVKIETSSFDKLIDETTNSKLELFNTYRKGYKFYLPASLYIKESNNYNEIIKSKTETFYLYFDLIGYLNKEEITYEFAENSFYKNTIDKDKKGFIEIKLQENNKYLVEIVYNYAKIEVLVEKSRIKSCVAEAMTILSSINYNDSFLQSLNKESLLNYQEETIDIFDNKNNDEGSNVLKWIEEYDTTNDSNIIDYDKIQQK